MVQDDRLTIKIFVFGKVTRQVAKIITGFIADIQVFKTYASECGTLLHL